MPKYKLSKKTKKTNKNNKKNKKNKNYSQKNKKKNQLYIDRLPTTIYLNDHIPSYDITLIDKFINGISFKYDTELFNTMNIASRRGMIKYSKRNNYSDLYSIVTPVNIARICDLFQNIKVNNKTNEIINFEITLFYNEKTQNIKILQQNINYTNLLKKIDNDDSLLKFFNRYIEYIVIGCISFFQDFYKKIKRKSGVKLQFKIHKFNKKEKIRKSKWYKNDLDYIGEYLVFLHLQSKKINYNDFYNNPNKLCSKMIFLNNTREYYLTPNTIIGDILRCGIKILN